MKRLPSARAAPMALVLLLILTAALLFPGCAQALSIEEEQRLGREFLMEIRRHFDLLEDEFALRFLDDLGQRFVRSLDMVPFPFRFYIVRNGTQNAFAAPGGNIFVFSGLVELLDRFDELAAVVAHEVGHVAARHLSARTEQGKRMGLATLAAMLAGALLGGDVGTAIIMGSAAAGLQAQLHYSREDERQADLLGFDYMVQEGFDPRGMLATLKKLERGRWLGSDKIPAYLQTHPAGPERMANLDTMLSRMDAPLPTDPDPMLRTRYPLFRTLVLAQSLPPQVAEEQYRRELQAQPDAPLPHFALGVIAIQRGDFDRAVTHLQVARATMGSSAPVLSHLGEAYLRSGRSAEAVRVLEEALRAEEEVGSTVRLLLGSAYENQDRHGAAARVFERLVASEPEYWEAHRHLGIVYGKQDRRARAHYHFGIYFRGIGQGGKAAFHFHKAAALVHDDPVLAQKIQQVLSAPQPPSGQ